MTELVFVYNSDSSFLTALKDVIHKVRSPDTYPCALCKLTHGLISERSDWRDFLDEEKYKVHVLHRNQFRDTFPSNATDKLPAAFIKRSSGLTRIISPEDFTEEIKDLTSLLEAVDLRVHQFNRDRTSASE